MSAPTRVPRRPVPDTIVERWLDAAAPAAPRGARPRLRFVSGLGGGYRQWEAVCELLTASGVPCGRDAWTWPGGDDSQLWRAERFASYSYGPDADEVGDLHVVAAGNEFDWIKAHFVGGPATCVKQ